VADAGAVRLAVQRIADRAALAAAGQHRLALVAHWSTLMLQKIEEAG
jgi:hypothetical protein